MTPSTRQWAGAVAVSATHAGAASATRRTGSPIAVAGMSRPSVAAEHAAASIATISMDAAGAAGAGACAPAVMRTTAVPARLTTTVHSGSERVRDCVDMANLLMRRPAAARAMGSVATKARRSNHGDLPGRGRRWPAFGLNVVGTNKSRKAGSNAAIRGPWTRPPGAPDRP